jgi:vacuolar-type H+-ATPase subunit D/Vma8
MMVKEELRKLGLHFIVVDLGEVEIMENISAETREKLKNSLSELGLELMDDKRAILIERITNVITELVHYADELPEKNYSVHISEKLNSYTLYL